MNVDGPGNVPEIEPRLTANLPIWPDTVGEGPGLPLCRSWTHQDDRHVFLLDVLPGLPCFEGHFPSQPVLPGVVQLHWAALLARKHFGFKSAPREVRRLKFRSIVVPPRRIELQMERVKENSVAFSITSEGVAHAAGTLIFGGAR